MASINGIQVKNVKKFKDHEGATMAQGNIYVENKKIGFWSQDMWGGPDIVELEDAYSEDLLEAKVRSLNEDKAIHCKANNGDAYTIDYSLDLLMADLLSLAQREKWYKDKAKKGMSVLIVLSDGAFRDIAWGLRYMDKVPDEKIIEAYKDVLEKFKAELVPEGGNVKHTVTIYRNLDDFNIGEKILLSDILA